jgi:hypothetical protein
MQIMKFKKWLRLFDLRESLKDSELNRILDKISSGFNLTSNEKTFLNKYDSIKEEDLKDFTHLSRESTFHRVSNLLNQNKKVVCDLYDKNGKIGLYIVSIANNFQKGTCTLDLKGGEVTHITDSCLYNLIYNLKKDEYSLQTQDEYFEKIPIDEK